MTDMVLDASAVLALAFHEPGADLVRAEIAGSLVSAVNQAEVLTRLVGEGLSPAEAADFTARLGYEVVPADSGTAVTISTFQHKTRRRGVSLGDQFCLALGIERSVPVLTGEKRWPQLGLDVEIILIR